MTHATSEQPAARSAPPQRGGLLSRAFEIEAGRLDLLRARAWLVVGFGNVAASSVVTVVDPRSGVSGLCIGMVTCTWFGIRRMARTATDERVVRIFDLAFEIGLTPAFLFLLTVFSGREFALNAFGPTLLFGGIIVLSLLRLDPLATALVGVASAALSFAVATLGVFIDDAPNASAAHQTLGLAARFISFAVGGVMGAAVGYGLRSAMRSVVRTAREQDLFGKYRLERKLAAGGMGEVWAATYAPEGGFEKATAIKLIHAHLARDETFVKAFRSEAALCARLVHDSIVQVFDFGRVDDRYFLAMERIDGPTLAVCMKRAAERRVRSPDAATSSVGRSLLAALAYAHEDARDGRGAPLHIVHRDVAPANVLLTWQGATKLSDFGIAKALRETREVQTESIVGHVNHMAPEQVSAGALDARTDLFCAAIILWELVCGQPLFRRANEAATLAAVATAKVPAPSSIDPAHGHWDAFFVRALAREPAERFTSARQMASALEAVAPASQAAVAAFIDALFTPSER